MSVVQLTFTSPHQYGHEYRYIHTVGANTDTNTDSEADADTNADTQIFPPPSTVVFVAVDSASTLCLHFLPSVYHIAACLPPRRQGSSHGGAGVIVRDDGVPRDQDGEGEGEGGAENSCDASPNSRSDITNGGGDGVRGCGDGQEEGVTLSSLTTEQPANGSDNNNDAAEASAAGVVLGQGGIDEELHTEFQAGEEAVPPSSDGQGSRSGDPALRRGEGESGAEGREGGRRGGGEGWGESSVSEGQTEEVMSPRTLDSTSSKERLPWLEPSEVMRHVSWRF